MKNADFKKALQQALQADGKTAQLETVVLLARQEARKKPVRLNFWQLLARQVTFIGWKLWSIQVLVLLAALWFLGELYGEPFWMGSVMRLLFCLSALVGMMALPLIYRSAHCRMQEIEAAAYFSCVKLLLARLLVLAVGDLMLLLGILAAAMVRTPLQAGSVCFSLCLPFLLVSSGSLYMLGHWRADRFYAGSLGLGTAVFLLTLVTPGRYLPVVSEGWLIFCGILLIFCAMELRYLITRSPYAELQV